MASTEFEVDFERISPAESLIGFLCPVCEQRLNVPASLAGVAGPCPSCQRVIRAPQAPVKRSAGKIELVECFTRGSGGGHGFSQWQNEEPDPKPRRLVAAGGAPQSFYATKRIAPTPVEGLDDSWRKKVERRRKQSRKRRLRNRLLRSRIVRGEPARRIGTLVILGILALTVGLIYLNHRSGGQILGGGLGR